MNAAEAPFYQAPGLEIQADQGMMNSELLLRINDLA